MRYLDYEHGLRSSINYEQLCKISRYFAWFAPGEGEQLPPLHVIGDSALVLSQLRSHHSPQKAHLALLFQKARDLADDIAVVSWGHHYRTFNKMADYLPILRWIPVLRFKCAFHRIARSSRRLQHSSTLTLLTGLKILKRAFRHRGPAATAKDIAISRLHFAKHTAAVRGQTLT